MIEEEEEINQPTNDSPQLAENEMISDDNSQHAKLNTQYNKKNMEVQKHPHHVTHKKKWGEYLLEFFMLFLAVFLGFVAENIREKNIEKGKEKVYMENVLEDLKADTAIYNNYTKNNLVLFGSIDTLIKLMKSPDRKAHVGKLAYVATQIQSIIYNRPHL